MALFDSTFPAHRRLRTRRAMGALTAAGVVLALAACSDGAGDPAPSANLDLPAKDLAHWVLPVDQYYAGMYSTTANAASDALFATCMTDRGFPTQPLPVRDESQKDPSFNAVQHKLFTPDLAATYGYHSAATVPGTPAQVFDAELKAAAGQLPQGEGAQAAWDGCQSETATALPTVPGDPLGQKLTLASAETAGQDEAVTKAAAAWKQCMKPLGITDLPASPTEFPSKSLREIIDPQTADGGVVALPSAQELQIAQQDAACQDSSGWRQTFYDAQWDAQVALLPDNLTALTADRKAFEDRDAAAQKILNSR